MVKKAQLSLNEKRDNLDELIKIQAWRNIYDLNLFRTQDPNITTIISWVSCD